MATPSQSAVTDVDSFAIARELLLEGAPGSPAGQAIVAAAAKHLAG